MDVRVIGERVDGLEDGEHRPRPRATRRGGGGGERPVEAARGLGEGVEQPHPSATPNVEVRGNGRERHAGGLRGDWGGTGHRRRDGSGYRLSGTNGLTHPKYFRVSPVLGWAKEQLGQTV